MNAAEDAFKTIRTWYRDLAKFDTPEVTTAIESLTDVEVIELCSKKGEHDVLGKLTDDVQALQKDLEAVFVDREEVIRMVLACFIAHLPMTLLGPPGTAKSNILRRLSYGLGLQEKPTTTDQLNEEMLRKIRAVPGDAPEAPQTRRYFEWLMTRFTTPEEIIGPAHLQLMISQALFYRQTVGLLPEAEVAFLDEFTRANSAILNAMLTILNERIFFNAGRPVRVPLCMLFGAINEPPREAELAALYDRFPVRVLCLPVQDSVPKAIDLLERSLQQEYGRMFPTSAATAPATRAPQRLATVNHFRFLHRAAMVRFGGNRTGGEENKFTRAYGETFIALRRGFLISDRSEMLLYRVARALAVLEKKDVLETENLKVFKYCFQDIAAAPVLAEAVDERIRRYKRTY